MTLLQKIRHDESGRDPKSSVGVDFTERVNHDLRNSDDLSEGRPNGVFRGVAIGTLMSLPLWAIIILSVRQLF
jgi:hypothetical protein